MRVQIALREGAFRGRRARSLIRVAADWQPDVALPRVVYAADRSPHPPDSAVTMMDYEYQPANHLSSVWPAESSSPEAFPARRLRPFGARPSKVVRYAGFKEELYLADFVASEDVPMNIRDDNARKLVVLRPPPRARYTTAQTTSASIESSTSVPCEKM